MPLTVRLVAGVDAETFRPDQFATLARFTSGQYDIVSYLASDTLTPVHEACYESLDAPTATRPDMYGLVHQRNSLMVAVRQTERELVDMLDKLYPGTPVSKLIRMPCECGVTYGSGRILPPGDRHKQLYDLSWMIVPLTRVIFDRRNGRTFRHSCLKEAAA